MTSKNTIDILITATDRASTVIKQTQTTLTDLWEKSNSLWKIREENKWKITAAAWATFAGITYYLKQGIDDINQYNYSIKRLETLTKNSTKATDNQIQSLIKQAENLEKVWVATKENIVASMSQFATFDMSTDAISKLTNAFIDYVVAEKGATASSEEYRSMANGLAQALQWNYQSLTRTGFILDAETKSLIENWTEMEKVEAIVKVLNTTYKDFNKIATETAEWKLILLKRSLNNIRETIAQNFLPLIETITSLLANTINKVAERVNENPKLATTIIWLTAAFTWLITILWTISLIMPAITAAFTILTGPIGLLIAAISALWIAYTTNFWWFRDFINEVREEISPLITDLSETITECFNQIRTTIKEVYEKLEPILTPLWIIFKQVTKESLTYALEIIIQTFTSIADSIQWITKIFNEFISFLTNIFHANRKEAFNNLINILVIWWETTIAIFENFWINLPEIFETLKESITTIRNNLFTWLKDICKGAVDRISDKISKIWDRINSAREAVASLRNWWSSTTWTRASWGTVIAWQTYRVNEIHGEFFTPKTNWTISASSPNWSYEVNISFGNVILNNWEDESQFAEKVKDVMIAVFKNKSLGSYA